MITPFDVDRAKLIDRVKEKLKEVIEKPQWVDYVKSSSANERLPEQKDFYYIRAASILWQLYKNGEMGVSRLRRHYGKRKNRGVKPEKHVKAGGKIIRSILQQLDKAGLTEKTAKGRKLSGKGRSLLDNAAKEVANAS